jgi:hypothetical protein
MQDDREYGSRAGFGGSSDRVGGGPRTGQGPRGSTGIEDLERRADAAIDDAAEKLAGAAERIDQIADRIPRKGVGNRAGAVGHSAADTLESVARFLRDNDVAGLQRDLGRLVSGRPVSMLLLAVGAGFVAGRVLR